jgi:cellulose synthase/poly-beta-1,6-N-acetylglucosamine synthase-like glycosyltransferase
MQQRHTSPALPAARDIRVRARSRYSFPSVPGEVWLTALALAVTLVATGLFMRDVLSSREVRMSIERPGLALRGGLFVAIVLMLVYGNLVYQLCRIGQLIRHHRHKQAPIEDSPMLTADAEFAPLVILVPSYKEDLRTIRQTLLSAALQDYPNRRIVLLLDDPPEPQAAEDVAALVKARRLTGDLNTMLQAPLRHIERTYSGFRARIESAPFDPYAERRRLLLLYREIAGWFAREAERAEQHDHTDRLFVELVYGGHQRRIQRELKRIHSQSAAAMLDFEEIERAFRWIDELFRVEITHFERKRFDNLAHAPNKASNLNAYIGLLGKRVHERWAPQGCRLDISPADSAEGKLVPDATYVITLDADSLLAPDYARRLVTQIEQPGFERVAVVQTPYTSIPGASGTLERLAGATTDIQYLIHQGFTAFDATYWVGANALLRKTALDDIRGEEIERGYTVPCYIQDRTVIEDTESTIDLISRGWRLFNYPERLAYSATPPDFGSLLIQRRRWANGGLLILPKLVRYAFQRPFTRKRPLELAIRLHYLISIAATSFGLLALLLFPLGQDFDNPWLALSALPYFLLYARDLKSIGYQRRDLLGVYAFNLLLLPINIAGVLKSVHQALTGEKIPFGRTPKVAGRTTAPAWSVLAEWLLLAMCLAYAVEDVVDGNYGHAAFTLLTGAGLAYAVVALVGVRASWEDLQIGWTALARRATSRMPGATTEAQGAQD